MTIIDCEREDCIIEDLGSSTTCMGWTPTYDKYGNCLTKDPNKTTTYYKCSVCNKTWKEVN